MIYNVQYLRFIAASMVVLHHTIMIASRYWGEDWPNFRSHQFLGGAAGVDIFFVISGFIMVAITEKKERSPLDFFRHRLTRIVPPYWVVTICLAFAVIVAPSAFQKSRFELPHFMASLLFFPYPHPIANETAPLYGPGWTLNYEFFFYSLFAIALAINASGRVALTSLALIALTIVGFAWPNVKNVAFEFYTNPILLEFVFGMIIGQMVVVGTSVRRCTSIGQILFGVAGLLVANQYWPISRLSSERFLVWGLPAALLVAGSIFLELRKNTKPLRPLVMLGNSSYAIYITHFIALGPVIKACKLVGLSPGFLLTFIGFAATTATGVLFHFVIERRLITFFSGRRRGPPLQIIDTPQLIPALGSRFVDGPCKEDL
jgi:exopolysaccharide production protein ExoZ